MKRKPLLHAGVFNDEAFAREYARKHWKMAAGFGKSWGKRLKRGGFVRGRILDVGCGPGATNLTLADQLPDSELVGIDLSDPLLEMAREAAREGRLADRVRFEKADVMEIPYEGGSFDVVLNLNMVHLVGDPPRMLGEIARVLRPGGFLFLADLKRSVLWVFEKEIRSALSSSEARELIRGSALAGGAFHAGTLWWRYERLPLRSGDQYGRRERFPRPESPFEDG